MLLAPYFVTFTAVFFSCSAFSLRGSKIFTFLGLLSLSTAWFFILRWILDYGFSSFSEMAQSDIFNNAYRAVVESNLHVLWSQQLMMCTLSIVLFSFVEQKRSFQAAKKESYYLSSWVYVVLGCLGALSCGFSLYLGQLLSFQSSPPTVTMKKIPYWLVVVLVMTSISVIISPLISDDEHAVAFDLNLKVMHLLVILPSFYSSKTFIFTSKAKSIQQQDTQHGADLASTYFFIAGMAFMAHLHQLVQIKDWSLNLTGPLFSSIFTNDCLASITSDLIFMSIATMLLIWTDAANQQEPSSKITLTLLIAPCSVSTILPLYLGIRESKIHKPKTL